jgi:hypothetical protein
MNYFIFKLHIKESSNLIFQNVFGRTNIDGILLTCRRHLHDRIISLLGEVWTHETSLTPPLFIDVSIPSQESERSCICVLGVSSQESERSCICVLGVSNFPLSTISIVFLKCSDDVVFLVFHFIYICLIYM